MGAPLSPNENSTTEVWRPVPGYEDTYSVSNLGRLRRDVTAKGAKAGRIARPTWDGRYLIVNLRRRGTAKTIRMHRLVALAFHGKPEAGQNVNHKNGDRRDNRASNLEWVYPKENTQHALRNGLMDNLIGEKHYAALLDEDKVRFIRRHYKPRCPEYGGCALGRRFGVSDATIRHVVKRETWRHL